MLDTSQEITKNTPFHLTVKNLVTTTDDDDLASAVYNMTRRMSFEIFDSMGTYIIICRYKHIKNTVALRRYIFIYLFFSF